MSARERRLRRPAGLGLMSARERWLRRPAGLDLMSAQDQWLLRLAGLGLMIGWERRLRPLAECAYISGHMWPSKLLHGCNHSGAGTTKSSSPFYLSCGEGFLGPYTTIKLKVGLPSLR